MFEEKQENPFSLSIGDLMAALLLLFVLVLMAVLLQFQEKIDRFETLNNELYTDLYNEFKDDLPKWKATLIDTTLSIRFEEPSLLFSHGSSELKPSFETILDNFFPRYLKIIRKPEYLDEISEIRIEGHTDQSGTGTTDENYLYNLGLSQERARSTLEYIFTIPKLRRSHKDWCISKLTANGLSWSKLIYAKNTNKVNSSLSRRVEFRVKIDAETKLRNLGEIVKEKNPK